MPNLVMDKEIYRSLYQEVGEENKGWKCVEIEDWEDDGKYSHRSEIYERLSDNTFWCYGKTRSGSYHNGYDYSSQYSAIDCVQVVKYSKTTTVESWVTPEYKLDLEKKAKEKAAKCPKCGSEDIDSCYTEASYDFGGSDYGVFGLNFTMCKACKHQIRK